MIVSDSAWDLDTSSDAPSEVYRAYLKRYIEGGETAWYCSVLFQCVFFGVSVPYTFTRRDPKRIPDAPLRHSHAGNLAHDLRTHVRLSSDVNKFTKNQTAPQGGKINQIATRESSAIQRFEDAISAAVDDLDRREEALLHRSESGIVLDYGVAHSAWLERPFRSLKKDLRYAVIGIIRGIADKDVKTSVHSFGCAVVRQDDFCRDAKVLGIQGGGLDCARMGIDHDKVYALHSRSDEKADESAAAAHVEQVQRLGTRLERRQFARHDLSEGESAIVRTAVAEAAGKARKLDWRDAGHAGPPLCGEIAYAARVADDLFEKRVPVALLALEIKRESWRLEISAEKTRYLLQQVERELSAHQLRTCLEAYLVPRAFRQMRRADDLRVVGLLYGVTLVYVEHMAGRIAVQQG